MFDNSTLWIRTLGATHYPATEKLRTSFRAFRERAAQLANEIHRYLPTFTVHDITHLDALWEVAETIMGETYPLNAAEAYILGGSFLLHDTAMSLSAYPGGIERIKQDPNWGDCIVAQFRQQLGRIPTPQEISAVPKPVEDAAVSELLRLRHAAQAEKLATEQWTSTQGHRFSLIEDDSIRETYGQLIGRIAHSHWWPVEKLRTEFSTLIGAPAWAPKDWTVDPLKIACILRCADAAHIDERRSPRFLAVLRGIDGESLNHWSFQGKLPRPRLEDDRLVFTCAAPFTSSDADAWWLCLDTLIMIDSELRQSDALLADTNRPRLSARSVAGAGDPTRLSQLIPTSGWEPVEARIKISDVASLVERLGGKELYGSNPSVPLRELLQNAVDAIRARRIIEDLPEHWGQVTVRLGRDDFGTWIEIEDTGIGMSKAVLTGPLLDFGISYWRTSLMRDENPGLVSRRFDPAGKYGIGFFSVFMWGKRVQVITRRAEDARSDTRVLEFRTGLRARPLLRSATHTEQNRNGGTRVRVWLKDDPASPNGLLYQTPPKPPIKLATLISRLAPASAADIIVEEDGKQERVVTAHDWKTIDGAQLLRRIHGTASFDDETELEKAIEIAAPLLRTITSETKEAIHARACLFPIIRSKQSHNRVRFSIGTHASVVGIGGIVTGGIHHTAGIFIGEPINANRFCAIPLTQGIQLQTWATTQATLARSAWPDETWEEIAMLTHALGGDSTTLPIATGASGPLLLTDVAHIAKNFDEILLTDSNANTKTKPTKDEPILNGNVISVDGGFPGFVLSRGLEFFSEVISSWPPRQQTKDRTLGEPFDRAEFDRRTLRGLVITEIAKHWGTSPEEIYKTMTEHDSDDDTARICTGTVDGKPHYESCERIKKP